MTDFRSLNKCLASEFHIFSSISSNWIVISRWSHYLFQREICVHAVYSKEMKQLWSTALQTMWQNVTFNVNVSINKKNLQPLMIVPMVQCCTMCEKWMKCYIGNYFSSPALFEHWKKEISCFILYHSKNIFSQFQAKGSMMMKGSVVSQGPCKSVDLILEGEMKDAYTDNFHDAHKCWICEHHQTCSHWRYAPLGYLDRCKQMATSYGMNRKTSK